MKQEDVIKKLQEIKENYTDQLEDDYLNNDAKDIINAYTWDISNLIEQIEDGIIDDNLRDIEAKW